MSNGGIANELIGDFVKACPLLHTIDMSYSRLDNRGLSEIGKGSPLLRTINIRNTRVGAEGISDLALGCPLLQYVKYDSCNIENNDGLISLGNNCHLLEGISFDFDPDGFYNSAQSDRGMRALGRGCPLLKSIVFGCPQITIEGYLAVKRGCPLLENITHYLDMSYSSESE